MRKLFNIIINNPNTVMYIVCILLTTSVGIIYLNDNISYKMVELYSETSKQVEWMVYGNSTLCVEIKNEFEKKEHYHPIQNMICIENLCINRFGFLILKKQPGETQVSDYFYDLREGI